LLLPPPRRGYAIGAVRLSVILSVILCTGLQQK